MTLIIQKPTGAKLNLAQTYVGIDDPDAAVYVAAVEAADGQSLETATKVAIHSFVKGCKADGIWPAIKASCILAGARTLDGALVPLVGAAPTNVGPFVSGDYNRKTGLVGDGSTKYLNSNRAGNADPQNNSHISVSATTADTTGTKIYLGDATKKRIGRDDTRAFFRLSTETAIVSNGNQNATGFIGADRRSSSQMTTRIASTSSTVANNSLNLTSEKIFIFARNDPSPLFSSARIAFYSIGESLDLALLDARVTDLINAFAAAIP
jgi:hypothetical protein